MKNLIKILIIFLFIFSIYSCTNTKNKKEANTLGGEFIKTSEVKKVEIPGAK